MKIVKKIVVLLVGVGLLAACTPAPGAGPTAGETGEPLQTAPTQVSPTPFDAPIQPPRGALEAQRQLAGLLSLTPEQITISEVESTEWLDSCLGLGGPAESCLRVNIPGYRVTLTVNGQEYVYRTDLDGEVIRAETNVEGLPTGEAGIPGITVDLPEEVIAAIAARMNVSPADLEVLEAEQVDWPDACLGMQREGIACAQVIVPGYRVVVEANGQRVQFRTDLRGGQVAQEDAKEIKPTGSLNFERGTGSTCRLLSISNGQAHMSACGETLASATISPARWEEWMLMVAGWMDFDLDGQEGRAQFSGTGKRPATPAEERSLAIWAGLVIDEIEAARDSAATGLAFNWHREGGIAGFCDDLAVYTSGFAVASTCKAQPEVRGRVRLTAEQLDTLYAWQEQYRRYETEKTDPAVADAMTIRVLFEGLGSQDAPEEVRTELEQMAGEMFNTAGRVK